MGRVRPRAGAERRASERTLTRVLIDSVQTSVRYAGFWSRAGAGFIDFLVMAPFMGLWYWGLSTSKEVALVLELPITLLFALYNIYFVGRWGQTIGKMAMKITVLSIDGYEAGFVRAFYRHSVDLGFAVLSSAMAIYALSTVSAADFNALSLYKKIDLLDAAGSGLRKWVDRLSTAWIIGELLVLLTNKKRRALHDFIAGTVVVHNEARVADQALLIDGRPLS
jgi:uncharacterized RDD family membrane protein YckC